MDDARLSELYDVSRAARGMRTKLVSSLQQVQTAHNYGSLKESMRRSRFLVSQIYHSDISLLSSCVAQLPASAKSGVLEPLVILEPLSPPIHHFLVYVSVRQSNLFI